MTDDDVRNRLSRIREAVGDISQDDIKTGETAECRNCGRDIEAVIDPISLTFDWGADGDYGCDEDDDDDGVGPHDPGDGHTPVGFKIVVNLHLIRPGH